MGEGGGLCIFVNKKWATNFTVRERISTRSYEMMTVSFRPHYLPREFGQVTVILLCVPGPHNAQAAECVAECYNRAISRVNGTGRVCAGRFEPCRRLIKVSPVPPALTAPWTCATPTVLSIPVLVSASSREIGPQWCSSGTQVQTETKAGKAKNSTCVCLGTMTAQRRFVDV